MSIDLDGIIYRSVYVTPGVYRMVQKDDFDAMVERIEDLELQLESAIKERDEYRSRIDAMFWCEACDRLEIERTPENAVHDERAAVVAWLREEMHHGWEADAIERGEHRRENTGTNEVVKRQEGTIRTVRDESLCMTSVYIDDELVEIVSDLQLMLMPRDGVSVDWSAWRAAKLKGVEHRREEGA